MIFEVRYYFEKKLKKCKLSGKKNSSFTLLTFSPQTLLMNMSRCMQLQINFLSFLTAEMRLVTLTAKKVDQEELFSTKIHRNSS